MPSTEQTVNATRYILIAIALLAVALILWTISEVIVIAFGSIVFATVLRALSGPLAKLTHWPERWALVAVVIALTVLVLLLFWLFGRQAASQFAEMRDRLPAAVEKVRDWVGNSQIGKLTLDMFRKSSEGDAVGGAGTALGATVGGVANFFLILVAGVYFAANPKLYRDGALRLLPPSRRMQVGAALDHAGEDLKKWLVAQIRLPAAVEKVRDWVGNTQIGKLTIDMFKKSSEGSAVGGAGTALGATAGGVANFFLILVAGVYFAANPKLYRDGALRLLPPSRRMQVGVALDHAGQDLKKWLVAQIIVMAAVGLMVGVGLALLKVPLSLSLGLLAGLLEFVPVVGPVVAGIPAVLLGFSQGPQTALYVLILYLVVQQIESNILTPLLQRWAVELPPVIALLSIVAAGLMFGVMGVIFATPMAVVVMAMVQHLYVEDTLENGGGEPKRPRRKHG